jgi:myo-inositol 2-dehydrogenase/D-chiro-inositol 1-dehydrogenase
MNMTVRFGLLGAGRIGKVHAKAVSANADAVLVAVADAFPEAANAIAKQYGCAVRTIEEIEKSADIDAVVICTPTDTHADLIERFARAGKAIFCEKPIDLDVSRVRECMKVVEETKGKLMVGFNRRFDPHFMAVRKAIDDGKIGDVEMVTIISRDPGAPPVDYIKRSGGIFRDMTIHDFDMARFLLGEEPVAVTAHAAVLVDPEIGKAGDYRQRLGHPRNRIRQAGDHLQLAPRHLWLRPAHRSARLEGRRLGRKPARRFDRDRQWRRLYPPAAP